MRTLILPTQIVLSALLPLAACTAPTDSSMREIVTAEHMITLSEVEKTQPALPTIRDSETMVMEMESTMPGTTAPMQLDPAIQMQIELSPTSEFARTCLERAAREGSMEAQLALGLCMRYGVQGEQDLEGATTWLGLAAEQGSAAAQCELGLMHLEGEGVSLDDELAAEWFQCSAEQGNPIAQYNLGLMYSGGHGVEQSLPSAREWFECSAENGFAKSHIRLGRLNELDSVSEGDLATAYQHYLIAEELGQDGAAARREFLAKRLPEDTRSKAKSRAAQWLLDHEQDAD